MIMMMQECFADLEESEQLMMAEQEASEGALTMTVVRAPVLRDSSSYVHDYAAGGRRHLLTLKERELFFLEYYCSLSRSRGGGAQLPHHPAQRLREHRLRVH